MVDTILQSDIAVKFIYPFLLVFFIIFAVLEKTKVLGDDKKQINALVSFVIGLIFVSAVSPKLIVGNIVLFLTVALVIVFVVMIIWGFVSAGDDKAMFKSAPKGLKWAIGAVIIISVIIAVFWAAGIDTGFFAKIFNSDWSDTFWTNAIFIVLIAVALAVALKSAGGSSSA